MAVQCIPEIINLQYACWHNGSISGQYWCRLRYSNVVGNFERTACGQRWVIGRRHQFYRAANTSWFRVMPEVSIVCVPRVWPSTKGHNLMPMFSQTSDCSCDPLFFIKNRSKSSGLDTAESRRWVFTRKLGVVGDLWSAGAHREMLFHHQPDGVLATALSSWCRPNGAARTAATAVAC